MKKQITDCYTAGLQRFLEESAQELQTVFDSSCGFRNVQNVLYKYTVEAVQESETLRNLAGNLCGLLPETLETGMYKL